MNKPYAKWISLIMNTHETNKPYSWPQMNFKKYFAEIEISLINMFSKWISPIHEYTWSFKNDFAE